MAFYLETFQAAMMLLTGLEPEVLDPLWRSLRIAAIATLVSSSLGIPLGALIALSHFHGKRLVISIFSTLLATPTVVVGLVVYSLYTRRGLLGPQSWLFSEFAIVSAEILISFPIITRLTISAVSSVDPRIRQTALTLGANYRQSLGLVLREAMYGIAVALIVGYGRVLTEVGAAIMVGGNIKDETRTLTTAITLETQKGNFSYALALGLILVLVFLVINVLLLRFQGNA